MARFLSWFTTKNGRIFTQSCVGITGLSIFGIQIAIHGPCQDYFQKLCQLYRGNEPKPLSSEVQELVDKVLQDCNLEEKLKKKLKFFNVIGQDLFHMGGFNFPWGARIGIPFNFDDRSNIDFSQLRLEGHDTIDWIIDGEDLLSALVISDEAKRFGLMREIFSCNFWDIHENALITTGCFFIPAMFVKKFNLKRNALNKISFKNRIYIYVICYALGYAFYRCLKDPTEHLLSRKVDRMAAEIGTEYLEGGIEFYEKTLQRNKALRDLLGSKGERMYKANGEENYWLLAPRITTKKRLELLQQLQKENKRK